LLSLQFQSTEIDELEKAYLRRSETYTTDAEGADEIAADAGTRIRNGQRTKKNLEAIFRWKHASTHFS
jgi:hypothetical protein